MKYLSSSPAEKMFYILARKAIGDRKLTEIIRACAKRISLKFAVGWNCAIQFLLNFKVQPQSLTSFYTTKEYSNMTLHVHMDGQLSMQSHEQ